MGNQILEYDIIENTLTGGKTFRGIIHHQRVLNNESLIREIVRRNSTVTRQEALAVIDLYEELIKEHLAAGNTITTGLFRADISMTGKFDSMEDKIDYKRHKARVVIRPAVKLNKQICDGLRFHKRRQNRNNTFFTFISEIGNRFPEGTVGTGGVFTLRGKGLKYHRYDNEYELTLTGADKQARSLRIISATYGKITALVPNDVPPGVYRLELVHRYGSVNRRFPERSVTVVAG